MQRGEIIKNCPNPLRSDRRIHAALEYLALHGVIRIIHGARNSETVDLTLAIPRKGGLSQISRDLNKWILNFYTYQDK